MAQHDFNIANATFPSVRSDINSVLTAINTTQSGTSRPSSAVAGTIWLDTTSAGTPILKYYDGADDISLATLDHSANTVNFSDSAFDLITDTTPQLGGDLDVNTYKLVSTSNGDITLQPNGTGDVVLSADTVKIGDSNADATITTDGTGDLILNTNSGSSSGSITIADGANGNITIAGNGTGQIIVNAGAVGTPTIAPTGDTNTGIFFPSADTIAFTEGGTEAMRINSSGNVLINTTSVVNSSRLSVVEDLTSLNGIGIKNTGSTFGASTDFIIFINSADATAGRINQTAATTVAYTTTSDYRLKENIVPMTRALDKVALLKPVTYTWKHDGSDGQGFIAHELQAVLPDAVVGEKDAVDEEGRPDYQGIDTSFLVATLTAAIQEQQALIEELKTRITTLENK